MMTDLVLDLTELGLTPDRTVCGWSSRLLLEESLVVKEAAVSRISSQAGLGADQLAMGICRYACAGGACAEVPVRVDIQATAGNVEHATDDRDAAATMSEDALEHPLGDAAVDVDGGELGNGAPRKTGGDAERALVHDRVVEEIRLGVE